MDLQSSLKTKCQATTAEAGVTAAEQLALTMKITQLGLEYIWPAKLKADPIALLKCMNPEAAGNLPRPLFGDYKRPFDIKEMYFNPGKSYK